MLFFPFAFYSVFIFIFIWCIASLIGRETRPRPVDTSATCGSYTAGTAKQPIWAVTCSKRTLLRTGRMAHLRIGWYEVTSYSSMTQWILTPSHGGSSTSPPAEGCSHLLVQHEVRRQHRCLNNGLDRGSGDIGDCVLLLWRPFAAVGTGVGVCNIWIPWLLDHGEPRCKVLWGNSSVKTWIFEGNSWVIHVDTIFNLFLLNIRSRERWIGGSLGLI